MLEAVGKLKGAPCLLGRGAEGCGYLEGLERGHGPAVEDLSKGSDALPSLEAPPPQGPFCTLGPQTKQPTGLPQPKQELEEGQLIGPPLPPHPMGLPSTYQFLG